MEMKYYLADKGSGTSSPPFCAFTESRNYNKFTLWKVQTTSDLGAMKFHFNDGYGNHIIIWISNNPFPDVKPFSIWFGSEQASTSERDDLWEMKLAKYLSFIRSWGYLRCARTLASAALSSEKQFVMSPEIQSLINGIN